MTSGTAIPSEAVFEPADRVAGRTDRFWVAIVRSVDALLRSYYGIHEFTDDPGCIFRIAFCRALEPVELPGGTKIHRGETVGTLHWWNEHLRPFSRRGPDIRWAGDMRRRIRRSLCLLAGHIEQDPAWRTIEAFRADAILSSRFGSGQIRRVAARYGFAVVEPERSIVRRFDGLAASVDSWALTRAFNPAAFPRQRLLRGRHQLWISRATLLQRYRIGDRASAGRRARHAERIPAAEG